MKVLALDDEALALEGLVSEIKEALPDSEILSFRNPDEAMEALATFVPDIVFLDIEMRTDNGVDVARRIKALNEKVNIIFVTGYSQYMADAFEMHASGYVLKPVTQEKILKELNNLRHKPLSEKRVFARTFGDFALFADGMPVSFTYAKSLELVAFLVDANGALCSIDKIICNLWEDDDTAQNKSYLRNLVSDIRHTLKGLGIEDILVSTRGFYGINKTKVSSDYFDFLERKNDALDAFNDEYMSQYSWAENTLGALMNGSL